MTNARPATRLPAGFLRASAIVLPAELKNSALLG
jgi:hypothetical protein